MGNATTSSRHAVSIILTVIVIDIVTNPCHKFSVNSYGRITPTTTIYRITGIPGGGTQSIPHSYVKNFARWRFTDQCIQDPSIINPISSNLIRDDDPPNDRKLLLSTTTRTIRVRPTMHFLVKGGIISYAMAGVQMMSDVDEGTIHLLLAQQWTSFVMMTEPRMRMTLYLGPADGTDERLLIVNNNKVRQQIEKIGLMMSLYQNDEYNDNTYDMTSGFHLVSNVMHDDWIDVILPETENKSLSVTCVLTGEGDAREVFTLDKDLIELTATSFLRMKVQEFCEVVQPSP
jgi:hypothetical protein